MTQAARKLGRPPLDVAPLDLAEFPADEREELAAVLAAAEAGRFEGVPQAVVSAELAGRASGEH